MCSLRVHNGNLLEKHVTDTCDFGNYAGKLGNELEIGKGRILDVENNRKLKGKLEITSENMWKIPITQYTGYRDA